MISKKRTRLGFIRAFRRPHAKEWSPFHAVDVQCRSAREVIPYLARCIIGLGKILQFGL
jgi:hypothetical protein